MRGRSHRWCWSPRPYRSWAASLTPLRQDGGAPTGSHFLLLWNYACLALVEFPFALVHGSLAALQPRLRAIVLLLGVTQFLPQLRLLVLCVSDLMLQIADLARQPHRLSSRDTQILVCGPPQEGAAQGERQDDTDDGEAQLVMAQHPWPSVHAQSGRTLRVVLFPCHYPPPHESLPYARRVRAGRVRVSWCTASPRRLSRRSDHGCEERGDQRLHEHGVKSRSSWCCWCGVVTVRIRRCVVASLRRCALMLGGSG